MKTIFLFLASMGAILGQGTFRLESVGETTSEINVPKGSVTIGPESHHFISADGKVSFDLPRTDLGKPSVQSFLSDGVYTYVITNDAKAAKAIDIIRLVPNGTEVAQVQGDPAFDFVGHGWIANDGAGLLPGQTITLSVRADGMRPGRVEMQLMSVMPVGSVSLPDNVPYGLRVLMRNHLKTHDHVGVGVIGPQ